MDFETGFRAIFSLFWPLSWLFCAYQTYHCKNTEKGFFAGMQPVLRHFPLYFKSFGGHCALKGRIVAKRLAETFFCEIWNRLYGIRRILMSTFVTILHHLNIPLPRYERKCFIAGLYNQFYNILCAFLSTLGTILRPLNMPLPRYGWKHVFASFITGFTAFGVLYWALWWLIMLNRTYCWELTGVKVSLRAYKSGFMAFTALF